MEFQYTGRIIKEFRTRKGLNQEKLAELCLCSVTTISRVETGIQLPSRSLVDMIFQKLGYTSHANSALTTNVEFQRYLIEKQMSKLVSQGNHSIADLLNSYKELAEDMSVLERQAYLFYSAVYDTEHEIPKENVLAKYNEALNLTFEDYWKIQKSKDREIFLTQNELLIIANIAIEKYALGLKDEAISIMEDLKEYYEKNFVDEEEIEKHFAVVLLSLGNWYDDKGEQEKALEMCEQGIRYGSKASLPVFITSKGYCLYKIGKKEDGISMIKNGAKLLEYLHQEERFKILKQYTKSLLGIDL